VKTAAGSVAATKVRVIVSLLKDLGVLKEQRGALVRLLQSGISGGNLAAMAEDYRTRQSSDREKLERMMAYGQSAGCRWKLLLEYFGETAEWERCGVCDNCRHPLEEQVSPPTPRAEAADLG
jgi:ATP-dependent DNA helicase RecQ